MNKERPDEVHAKKIVERVLGVYLSRADFNGGVDYRSTDRAHAIEVTRITDGRKRAARKSLEKSRRERVPGRLLQTCWLTFVPESQYGLASFLQRVQPALTELELAGEVYFEGQLATAHVIQRGPLAQPYRDLLAAGVSRASAMPVHAHHVHAHQVIPLLGGGGGISGGSDQALGLLLDVLGVKDDNHKKLSESGAERRHLFIWLDDDTQYGIARPLSRDAPSWHDGFGPPLSRPALAPAITDLWVVHEGSRRGWLWDGVSWRELHDL